MINVGVTIGDARYSSPPPLTACGDRAGRNVVSDAGIWEQIMEDNVEDDELDRIDRVFAEGTPIDAALIEAVREARQRHKEAGTPVAEWRDGKLYWVAPQDIELEDEK